MNDQTVAFQCIYDIFTISDTDLSTNTNILADLYNVDADQFVSELIMFRALHAGEIVDSKISQSLYYWNVPTQNFRSLYSAFKSFSFYILLPLIVRDHSQLWTELRVLNEVDWRAYWWTSYFCTILLQRKRLVYILLILREKFSLKFGNIRRKINLALSFKRMLMKIMHACLFN